MLVIMTAGARRQQTEHNGRVWLAWNTAALHRTKRMPPLQSLIMKPRPARPQTWKEQMRICQHIASAYGSRSKH